ncbi:calcium-binding protein [Agrobacterium tumefaciens]|uniref:calcium-binding protein n=1 Tax=Agrobacterium tumefaciens TaxID=358 RepID=UPI00286386B6|nr:calcium-binding protein [Agrobacterium tumefaciens]MDR6586884.1 hypothetical protein [Agrobacterium tumefaciens]
MATFFDDFTRRTFDNLTKPFHSAPDAVASGYSAYVGISSGLLDNALKGGIKGTAAGKLALSFRAIEDVVVSVATGATDRDLSGAANIAGGLFASAVVGVIAAPTLTGVAAVVVAGYVGSAAAEALYDTVNEHYPNASDDLYEFTANFASDLRNAVTDAAGRYSVGDFFQSIESMWDDESGDSEPKPPSTSPEGVPYENSTVLEPIILKGEPAAPRVYIVESWFDPVVLDLTGNGLNITSVGSSNTYLNMEGDGLQHKTAWAGSGNGVLVLDQQGSGDVNSPESFIFTSWDPTAKSNTEALANVFDTNGNGMLDAGDARWSEFKILVSNPDGTQQLQTLDQLGIASIDLSTDNNRTVLGDGSVVLGQGGYTRTDGTTGTMADVQFVYDGQGYIVDRETIVNPDGSTSILTSAFHPDGSVAYKSTLVTSADGLTKSLEYDIGGDGVLDTRQTEVTTINSAGDRTQTISNYAPDARLLSREATSTSADKKNVTITRDLDGNGSADQVETRIVGSDNSTTTTIRYLNQDGSQKEAISVFSNAGGTASSVKSDLNGDGIFDVIENRAVTLNGNGSRTEEVLTQSSNGTVTQRVVTTTSADGRSKEILSDKDGNGVAESKQNSGIVVATDGSSITTQNNLNGDGSLRSGLVTTLSADGLTKTVKADFDGNGVFDLVTEEITIINVDGGRTKTIVESNADASLLAKSTSNWSADGKTRSDTFDTDGDGDPDFMESVSVLATGESENVASVFNPDGSLKTRTTTITSADGLTTTILYAGNAAGTTDRTQIRQSAANSDGSSTVTTSQYSASGVLLDKMVITTSADGLEKNTQWHNAGSGTISRSTNETTTLNPDGSQTQTVIEYHANGSVRATVISTLSADRLSSISRFDANGDGHLDRQIERVTASDGSFIETVSGYNPDGSLKDRTITTRSDDNLSTVVQRDANGDGVYDQKQSTSVVLNGDGSKTTTVSEFHPNGSTSSRLVTTVSGNGLVRVVEYDRNGDGVVDEKITDTTVLKIDGGKTQTITHWNGDGTVKQQSVTTTNGNELSQTATVDKTGAGRIDNTRTEVTVYNADGSQTHTIMEFHRDGSLKEKTVKTTSANGNETVVYDLDGDAITDQRSVTHTAANGDVVTTVIDYNSDGSLRDKAVNTTGSDGRSMTLERDTDGDGTIDLTETLSVVSNQDSSQTETRSSFNGDGSLREKVVVTTSVDAQVETTQWDTNGTGGFDLTQTKTSVLSASGESTETVSVFDGLGVLQERVVTKVSPDERTTTITTDKNGDGHIDQIETSVLDAAGNTVVTTSDFNAGGGLERRLTITTGDDGLSKTRHWDTDGNGSVDQTQIDVTVLNSNGSQTQTVSNFTSSGALADRTVVTTSADAATTTYNWDNNGDGIFDQSKTETLTVGPDGTRTQVTSYFKADGSLEARYEESTSDDGLSIAKRWDKDGDGTFEETASDVTVLNSDGSTTQTIKDNPSSDTVVSTTADGLTKTKVSLGLNGETVSEAVHTLQNADGSRLETREDLSFKTTTYTSADGRVVEVTHHNLLANTVSQTAETRIAVDGTKTVTVENFNHLGVLTDRQISVTSRDGQTITDYVDLNGDGVTDRIERDISVTRADGSVVRTIVETNSEGSIREKTVITTSADGRSSVLQRDSAGLGYFDHVETTTHDASGASRTIYQTFSTDGFLLQSWQKNVRADGKVTTITTSNSSPDGLSNVETHTSSIDGSTTSKIDYVNLPDNQPLSSITTTLHKDGKSQSIDIIKYLYIVEVISQNAMQIGSIPDGFSSEISSTLADGSKTTQMWRFGEDISQLFEEFSWESASGESKFILNSSKNGIQIKIDGDDNSISLSNHPLAAVVLFNGDGSQYDFARPSISNSTISISGQANKLWASNSTILLANSSSATINGMSNTVIAGMNAEAVLNGNDNRLLRTQADISGNRSIESRHYEDVRLDSKYGFSYITTEKTQKTYFEADKIPVTIFGTWDDTWVYTVTTHVFLNGPIPSSGHWKTYEAISVNDARTYVGGYPALMLDADGYVGYDGGQRVGTGVEGNWVTALGDRSVSLVGSNMRQAIDYLTGGNGNDIIDGRAGETDILQGGAGDDTIYFDAASYGKPGGTLLPQAIDGGSGYDTGIVTSTGDVNISLATGNFEALISNSGNDTITGNPNAAGYIDGGAGNDTIIGGLLDDILLGGTGHDALHAGQGHDFLIGGWGNDFLSGQDGNDVLNGSDGNDVLNGGSGSDTFIFNLGFGHDTIQDFTKGQDVIEFEYGLFANWQDLVAKTSQVGADTKISYDAENSILMQNVAWAQLGADDFRFV